MLKKIVLGVVAALCIVLTSCSSDDDSIRLTVKSNAYDVFSSLVDENGQRLISDQLENGRQVRFSYFLRKSVHGYDDEIIETREIYSDNIKSTVQYTSPELEPGEYYVVLVADLIEQDQEYNELTVESFGYTIDCKQPAGALNAFGTAYVTKLEVTEKKEITLNPQRQGALVTILLKNPELMRQDYCTLGGAEFQYYADFSDMRFSSNSKSIEVDLTPDVTKIQYYCTAGSHISAHNTIAMEYAHYYDFQCDHGENLVVQYDYETQSYSEVY